MNPEFSQIIQHNALQAWLFIPGAVLLGALHGLEPGHSKSVMAAFIVAIRGTPRQALLLGVAAAISHTAIVWLIVIVGLIFGRRWIAGSEPYLHLLAALLMIGLALSLILRRGRQQAYQTNHNHHDHGAHADDHNHHHHPHSLDEKNEPQLTHEQHGDEDAHAQSHAKQMQSLLAHNDGQVTTWQIITFGLTGGLLPCPAAITVLLLCLQFEQISLGIALVLAFSVGLAITLVGVGVVAALGTRHVGRRWPGFTSLTAKAPYFSGILILAIGLYSAWRSLEQIATL